MENKKWYSLAVVLTAPLLSAIDVFIVNIAIPTIQNSLKASDSQMQLIVAGYLLGYASFMITGGRSGDYYGRKKVFFWSMLAFTITSAFCGISQSADGLNISRFFQGVSASFMVPQTIAYIQMLFPDPQERTKAIGFYGMTLGLASTLGQFLGGYFSSGGFFISGWRLIFFINLPIGLISLIAVYFLLPESSKNKNEKFDYQGTVLLTLSLIFLIYPLVQGRETGWPIWCFAMLGISICLLIFFLKDQVRKTKLERSPLIDTTLFTLRDFNIGLIAVVCYFIFHTSYLFISTLHFQETLHLTAMNTGMSFIFFGLGFTVASLLSIKLVSRFGKSALQGGVIVMIAMLAVQMGFFTKGTNTIHLNLALFCQGLGMGVVLPSLLNFALKSVPVQFAGAASGVYSTFQQVASAIGITLVGGIYFFFIKSSPTEVNGGVAFQAGMISDITALIMLGIALYLLPDTHPIAKTEEILVH